MVNSVWHATGRSLYQCYLDYYLDGGGPPPSHPLELPLLNSDSHRENPTQCLLPLPWVPRKCDKFPPKDTTASELCPCPTCPSPGHPLGTYLKESAGMTLQTSRGKDNPGPDDSSLCLADCTSSLERVSGPRPGPPLPSFPPSFCLRPEFFL